MDVGFSAPPPRRAMVPGGPIPLTLACERTLSWDVMSFSACVVDGVPYAVGDQDVVVGGVKKVRLAVLRLDFRLERSVSSVIVIDQLFDGFRTVAAAAFNSRIFVLFVDMAFRFWSYLVDPQSATYEELDLSPKTSRGDPGSASRPARDQKGGEPLPIAPLGIEDAYFPQNELPRMPYAYIVSQCSKRELLVKAGPFAYLVDVEARTVSRGPALAYRIKGSSFFRRPTDMATFFIDGDLIDSQNLHCRTSVIYMYNRQVGWQILRGGHGQGPRTPARSAAGSVLLLGRYVLLVGGKGPSESSGHSLYLFDLKHFLASPILYTPGESAPQPFSGADKQQRRQRDVQDFVRDPREVDLLGDMPAGPYHVSPWDVDYIRRLDAKKKARRKGAERGNVLPLRTIQELDARVPHGRQARRRSVALARLSGAPERERAGGQAAAAAVSSEAPDTAAPAGMSSMLARSGNATPALPPAIPQMPLQAPPQPPWQMPQQIPQQVPQQVQPQAATQPLLQMPSPLPRAALPQSPPLPAVDASTLPAAVIAALLDTPAPPAAPLAAPEQERHNELVQTQLQLTGQLYQRLYAMPREQVQGQARDAAPPPPMPPMPPMPRRLVVPPAIPYVREATEEEQAAQDEREGKQGRVSLLTRISPFLYNDELCRQSSCPSLFVVGGGVYSGHNDNTIVRIPLYQLGQAIEHPQLRGQFLDDLWQHHKTHNIPFNVQDIAPAAGIDSPCYA